MFYLIFLSGIMLSFSKNKTTSAKIYTGILVIVAMFRYGSGPDYFSYQYLFTRLRPSMIDEYYFGSEKQELGFRLLGATLKQFGFSYQMYLSLFAIITLYYIYKISKEYSMNPTLSLTIYYSFYYFVWTYSGIRQGLTLAIGTYYLLKAVNENQVKNFVLVTVLLSFIHTSSIILIFLFLISRLHLDKSKLIILTLVSALISVFPIGIIITKLLSFVPILNKSFLSTASSISFNNILDFQTIGRLFFLVLTFLFYDKYVTSYPNDKMTINLYILSFVVYFVFKFSELTAARLAIYGKMLDILILTNIIYSLKLKWNRVMFQLLILSIMTLYLFKELQTMEQYTGLIDYNPVSTPYVNIFNEESYFYETRYNLLDIN